MKPSGCILAAFVVALGALLSAASAETRYVSDTLVIDLREGPSSSARTLGHLRTGDSVEVLQEQGNFLKVRTREGQVGWVAAQYTATETPKAEVIAELQAEVRRLERELVQAAELRAKQADELARLRESSADSVGGLEELLSEARRSASRTSEELEDLRARHDRFVEQSGEVLEIAKERDRLKEEHAKMASDLKRYEAERESLTRSAAIRWFLVGAGVLLIGWVLGAVSHRRKGRRYGP